MDETSKLIGFIVLLITFSGLMFGIIKKIFSFIKKYWDMFNVAFAQLEYVYKEVKPNHGSSIYDKINKISKDLESTNKEVFIQTRISRQIRDDVKDVMYCEFDEYGEFVFANKKLEDITGIQTEDMFGLGWLKFVCEKDRDEVYKKWNDSLEHKTPFIVSFCMISKDGTEESVIMKVQQIRDSAGNITYFLGRIFLK